MEQQVLVRGLNLRVSRETGHFRNAGLMYHLRILLGMAKDVETSLEVADCKVIPGGLFLIPVSFLIALFSI